MEKWRRDLYLLHHGILGQKWGKRNGPPYPIGIGNHSTSEIKAGWRKSINNTESEETVKGTDDENRSNSIHDNASSRIEKAIDIGDINYAAKHIDEFTVQQLNNLYNVYSSRQRIIKTYKENKKNKTKIFKNATKTLLNSIKNTDNVINNVNSIDKNLREIITRHNN